MLIVLEGPDYSGKSSLASDVRRRLEADGRQVITFRAGPPKAHPLNEYVTPLLAYQVGRDPTIICDRWHLGEVVYPQVLRRNSQLDLPTLNYIELFLASRGVSITVLRPPLEELRRRSGRGDDLISDDMLPRLWELYEKFRMYSPPSRTADEVIANAEGRTAWALPAAPFITYVGHPRPRVIYVGEIRNCTGSLCRHPRKHSTYGTAFMPYPATSGHYLMTSLGQHGFDPRIGLINACDVDDVHDAWVVLGKPSMVALGAQAHRKMVTKSVPHAVAPHPQYVRRFHHAAAYEYGRLLLDLVGTERNEMKWRPSSKLPRVSAPTRRSLSVS